MLTARGLIDDDSGPIDISLGYIDQHLTISTGETCNLSAPEYSPAAEAFLHGVLLITGADVVLAPGSSFSGVLAPGTKKIVDFLGLIPNSSLPQSQFTLVPMTGRSLVTLIQTYLAEAQCQTLQQPRFFLRLVGLRFEYTSPDCRIKTVRYCRTWILEDPLCHNWVSMDPSTSFMVAIDNSVYTHFVNQSFFNKELSQQMDVNLIDGIIRYFRQYNGTTLVPHDNFNLSLVSLSTKEFRLKLLFLLAVLSSIVLMLVVRQCLEMKRQDRNSRVQLFYRLQSAIKAPSRMKTPQLPRKQTRREILRDMASLN
ncbi:hypothetical protein GMRT_20196 [Giardia muris]|uniref:5'-nucleotidase n=1 Tax=Giardia muris TaxID=5742 RepID=A0A4Z1SX57_GIAMU|nr:hypothetical protein GMRT_20196 [Giardia muris]|eukprot:TNJ29415.1 hypothetical protein GMRT_20196 [Giardia muris]